MDKTEFLAKGPTARHVYERTQYFLQNDPDLQDIVNDFTPEMFTTTGIEVLGTPIGTDTYIKDFLDQNSIKIMKDVVKASDMRISVPLDLSSRSIIPLPCFIRSRSQTPLLDPSLVFFPPCSV
jgi:hypothetical protein